MITVRKQPGVCVWKLRWAGCLTFLAFGASLLTPGIRVIGQQRSDAFSQLKESAAKASAENRLDAAAQLYGRALALNPGWTQGWWALGTLQYDQDHYAKAARAFERLLALKPTNGTAHAMLGLCQFELGQDDPALKNLLSADAFGVVKDQQLRRVALFHIGLLQLRTRKFSAARETLAKLAADKIETRELTRALGLAALLVTPQTAPAEGSDGARIVENVGQAEMFLARKDFERAREIYTNTAKESPDFPRIHLAFGRFLLDAREVDDAVKEFQRALDRDPKDVNAMLEIAAARYQSDSKDGLKYAEEAVKLSPKVPFTHYILGLLRLDTGDAEGSIPELELANKAFPKEASVYFSLGKAYARLGRKAEAAKARAAFVRLNKDSASTGPTTYGEHQILKLDSSASGGDAPDERQHP